MGSVSSELWAASSPKHGVCSIPSSIVTIFQCLPRGTTMMISKDDLKSLLIFEEINNDWAREVHSYTSMRKRKQSYVVFRNRDNRKVFSLEELLDEGIKIDTTTFQSATDHSIVSNKVGARKRANKKAKIWLSNERGVSPPKSGSVPEPIQRKETPLTQKKEALIPKLKNEVSAPKPKKETPAPITEASKPKKEASARVVEAPAPVVEAPTPVVAAPAPVVEAPAPVVEAPAPVVEAPAPVVEAPAPVVEAPTPVEEAPAPIVETSTPVIEAPAPVVETATPVVEAPAPEVKAPAPVVETPVSVA